MNTEIKHTHRILLSPAMSRTMLTMNTNNRPVSAPTVNQYAKAMLDGKWVYNGDSIRISSEGVILDGQHRLLAVIKSNCNILVDIIEGLPPSVFDKIDQGKVRTSVQAAEYVGIRSAAHVSPTLPVVMMIQNRMASPVRIPAYETVDLLAKYPSLYKSVELLWGLRMCFRPTILSGCHYWAALEDRKKADDFFMQVREGAGLSINSPAHTVRRLALIDTYRMDRKTVKHTPRSHCELILRAWRMFMDGKSARSIRLTGITPVVPEMENI